MTKPLTQAALSNVVQNLWKKCNDLEREAMYCRQHNYMIEAQVLDSQVRVLKDAIFEVEQLLD